MRIKVILEPSEEGGYTVFVPSLPGCMTKVPSLSYESLVSALQRDGWKIVRLYELL